MCENKKKSGKLLAEVVINQEIYGVGLPFIPKEDDILETADDRFVVKKVIYVEKDNDFIPRVYLVKEL
jgi:hypothetical protein